MGSRTDDTLKEIDEIKARLDRRLSLLDQRVPSFLKAGKAVAVAVVGSSLGGTALRFGLKRRVKAKRKEREERTALAVAPPIQVLPKGAVPVALGIAAVWAGVRIYEARMRGGRRERPSLAPVRDLPATGQAPRP